MTQTRTIAKIAAFYSLVACVGVFLAFHPTLLSQFTKAQADTGDTRFVNYVLEHSFQAVFHPDRTYSLWSPQFFYPFKNTLALSENLFGTAPLYWLARAFFSPDLAYQWWTIACAVLCYFCFVIFLRSLRVSHVLSAFGGFIFGFGLIRIGRLFHSQLLPQFFTPIALLFIWKFLRQPTPNRLRIGLVYVFLQVAASIYLGWFLLFSLLIFVPLILWFDRTSSKNLVEFIRQNWQSTIATFAIWFGALVWLLFPYLQMSKLLGARPFAEVELMLPRLVSWISPFPHTLWYSSLSSLSQALPFSHEHHIFAGFTLYALVGFALYSLIAKPAVLGEERAILIKACLVTAFILVGLSLYVAPGVSLWRIIYTIVPGATAMRAVSRLALLVQCFLLIAAVLSLDSALKRSRIKPKFVTAIALLILAISIPENFISTPSAFEKKPVLQTEAELGELMRQGCDLAYINLNPTAAYFTQQISAMWAGLNTKIPVINGYSGSQPPAMPGTMVETLPFSGMMQWLQSFESPPVGRLCLIAPSDHPLTVARQVEDGISIESLGSKTQYLSRDRRYTAFVIPLPIPMPSQAYQQGIRAADKPTVLTSEQILSLPVFVRNTSPSTWVQSAAQPIKLSYRWVMANGQIEPGEGIRTELPTVMPAGSAIALNATIKAPSRPGQYTLRLSLVHETVAWFMSRGAKSLDLPITVVHPPEGLSNGKPKP